MHFFFHFMTPSCLFSFTAVNTEIKKRFWCHHPFSTCWWKKGEVQEKFYFPASAWFGFWTSRTWLLCVTQINGRQVHTPSTPILWSKKHGHIYNQCQLTWTGRMASDKYSRVFLPHHGPCLLPQWWWDAACCSKDQSLDLQLETNIHKVKVSKCYRIQW
jgi:hypothetical protein